MAQINNENIQVGRNGGQVAFPGINPVLYQSPINTPVFSDLSIRGDSYELNGFTYSFSGIKEPSALFKVKGRNVIVKTSLRNRPGTVKEWITPDDFEIECVIVLDGSNMLYPAQTVDNYIQMLKCNKSLRVDSWYLNQFGITDIVITEYDVNQTQANIGRQVITFSALSDENVLLGFQNPITVQ